MRSSPITARASQSRSSDCSSSPHYGEKLGRHWLDAARHADSDGFEKDKSARFWFYRDWVVKAFNTDMPYDRFVIATIAGDQLPNPTQDDLVATGFLRNSMLNEEGGDRSGTVPHGRHVRSHGRDRQKRAGPSPSSARNATTTSIDPLKQEEYYHLFAFMNNDHEATTRRLHPRRLDEVETLSRRMKEIEADLKHKHADWEERMAEWEKSVKGNQPEWVVLTPRSLAIPAAARNITC